MNITQEKSFLLTQEQYDFIKKGGISEDYIASQEELELYNVCNEKIQSFTNYFEYVAKKVLRLKGDEINDFINISYIKYMDIFPQIKSKMNMNQKIYYITKSCVRNFAREKEKEKGKIDYSLIPLDKFISDDFNDLTYLDLVTTNIPSPSQQYEIDRVTEFYENYIAKNHPTLYTQTKTGMIQTEIAKEQGCTRQYISLKLIHDKKHAKEEAFNRNLDFSSIEQPKVELHEK